MTEEDPIVMMGPEPDKREFEPIEDPMIEYAANEVIAKWARLRFPDIPEEATDIELSSIVFEFHQGYAVPGFEVLWQMPDDGLTVIGELAMRTPNQLEFRGSFEDVLPEIIAVAKGLLGDVEPGINSDGSVCRLTDQIDELTERVTQRNERIALLIRERDELKSKVKSLEARVKRRDERIAAMKSHLEWREAQPSYKVVQGEKVDLKRHDILLCSGWVEGWQWRHHGTQDSRQLLYGDYSIDKHDWVCIRPTAEKSVADILRAHQQLEDSTCLCGFKELGASHEEHVENILGLAGKLKETS